PPGQADCAGGAGARNGQNLTRRWAAAPSEPPPRGADCAGGAGARSGRQVGGVELSPRLRSGTLAAGGEGAGARVEGREGGGHAVGGLAVPARVRVDGGGQLGDVRADVARVDAALG